MTLKVEFAFTENKIKQKIKFDYIEMNRSLAMK